MSKPARQIPLLLLVLCPLLLPIISMRPGPANAASSRYDQARNDLQHTGTHPPNALKQTPSPQLMAIPAYFYPGPLWKKMDGGFPVAQVAIMNPNNGPGKSPDANYVKAVQQAQMVGISVLGYVYTSYGQRPLSDVENDINLYYSWYHVDGIFLDEASTDCSLVSSYYAPLYSYIKGQSGKDMVITNQGTQDQNSECYMAVSDVMVNFEDNYAHYLNNYVAESWNNKYPANRFWHIIYSAPGVKNMKHAVSLSESRNAGWVYVTPDGLPNPYDTLPPHPYWTGELQALQG